MINPDPVPSTTPDEVQGGEREGGNGLDERSQRIKKQEQNKRKLI